MGSAEHAHELTTDDLVFIHEELPVGDYFTIHPKGDGVLLHDVITREPLTAGAVPQSILLTPELIDGIAYLRHEAAGRLTVQLVLGAHGSADDFRDIAREHSDVLHAPWIAMEMSWRTGYLHRPALQPDKVAVEPVGHEYAGRRAFQTEELLWAHDNQKKILPCELATDNTTHVATELSHLWNEVYEPINQAEDLEPQVQRAAALITERAYQAARQWTIVAQLGNWLMRLDSASRLPEHTIKLPLIIGSWHERSADRFRSLGVDAEVYSTPHAVFSKPEHVHYGTLIMDATYSGHATMELLQTPMPPIS